MILTNRKIFYNRSLAKFMRYTLTSIFILICSSSAFGEEGMECPNRETDPTKFCLPGQAWNDKIKECVNLV